MAASTHWLASSSAMAVLERGGNAFDASVAAGFVLQIVEPNLNGAGGELVGILATAADPTPIALAGTGPAPAMASVSTMRAIGVNAVPGAGLLAAPVPGQVDAWLMLLKDHGTWELDDVLSYAMHYARVGFPATPGIVATIANVANLFASHWPSSFRMWTPAGRIPRVGETLKNPQYARTMERLIERSRRGTTRAGRIDAARREWSEGFVAGAIGRFARQALWNAEGGVHAGLLTSEDLAGYQASYEPTVSRGFHGAQIHKVGPWTQGPGLLQLLGLLDGFPEGDLDPGTVEGAHLIIESIKLAMADRDRFLGSDDAPLTTMLSQDYLRERRSLISSQASGEFRPGVIHSASAYVPPLVTPEDRFEHGAFGEPTVRPTGVTRGDTCHLDVVDRWGNIISVTPSGGWLQSSPHIDELGFSLSSRLQQTWLDEASPACLAPGKRPRITLTPTLVVHESGQVTALGTPGGDAQDQWQALFLIRSLLGGYSIQQAIDAPAFQSTSFPDSFWPRHWTPNGVLVEDRFSSDFISGLESRGHLVQISGEWSLGRLSAVSRDTESGLLTAGANPRGSLGYAVGR